jgi:hypothetical protein
MVGLKHVYVEVGNRWNYSNKARLVGKGLSSGMAWDKSCHCGISVVKGSLYEVCRLGANRMKQRCKQQSSRLRQPT